MKPTQTTNPPMMSGEIIQAVDELITLMESEQDPSADWAEHYDTAVRISEIVDTLGEELPVKLDAISFVIDRLAAKAKMYRAWEKELAQKRHANENAIARLKGLATSLLTAARSGGMFLDEKTGKVKISRDKDGASRTHYLQGTDAVQGPETPEAWPEAWQTQTIKPNKRAALEAIKATGEIPDGFEVVHREGWRSR